MELDTPAHSTPASAPKRTALLTIGIILVVAGLVLPGLISNAALQMPPGSVRSALFISTDLFRLGFFAGVVCSIIGVLRMRKAKV